MYYGKKIYDKITKFIKLSAIWVIRVLFSPNNFKVPLLKRIYYAINGGFMADQIALYNLNSKNKKEYLSEFDWYKSRYINEPYNFILNNKLVAVDILKQYTDVPKTLCIKKKGIIYKGEENFDDIDSILSYIKKEDVYIKPINIGKGIGVNKISYHENKYFLDYKEISSLEIKKILEERSDYFISTSINQSKALNKIYDKCSNTIRLITVRDEKTKKCKVLFAVQRIGTKETIPVDNGSRGGLIAKIDIETGELSEAKSLHSLEKFDNHPDSNNPIKGVKIKDWDKIKKKYVSLMEKFPYLYFVAWDILLTDKGPVIIEANTSSGVNIIQVFGGQRNKELGDFYRNHKIIK